jgi:hypothetical protein
MSIQAVAWALEQEIPGTAKLVLISLANRADHVTGHCWPSMERIAKEASCSKRSIHTYISALKRNGFLDVRSGRGKTGGAHTNDYWLLMDRSPAPWDFGKRLDDHDPEDPEDISEVADEDERLSANIAHSSHTVCATRLPTKPSLPEPSEDSESLTSQSAPKPPADFDPNARKAEIARQRAADEARSKNKIEPVIQGTKAWGLWVAHGHKPGLVTWVIVKGKQHRGWYFPSLFPPKSTGPPSSKSPLMTPQDEEELEDL